MDRAVMRRWGIEPAQFTAGIGECQTDDQLIAWLSERVPQDRARAANAWVLRQRLALDVQDLQEGVPGAATSLALTMMLSIVLWGVAAAAVLFVLRHFHLF
jgi:hypothetical protein